MNLHSTISGITAQTVRSIIAHGHLIRQLHSNFWLGHLVHFPGGLKDQQPEHFPREFLEEQARKALEKAREMGVEDNLINFEGLTPQMLEALAEDGIKSLEDFATCADWELAGGWTTVDGERVKDDGILESFDVSLAEAQELVMTARVMLGWVDPEDLLQNDDAEEVEEE